MTTVSNIIPYFVDKVIGFITEANHPDLIVFSHLRWDSIFQRPHHLMSRFAQNRKIFFVEENDDNLSKVRIYNPHPNISVLVPNSTWNSNGSALSYLIKIHRKSTNSELPVLWFYSPMFAENIDHVPHGAVVYDCMDELANFKFAPQELREKESYLISNADIVFTGGKSLFESKQRLHDAVYCFPSSVDINHFASVKSRSVHIPEDLSRLPKPVVLYYGAIDERIDLSLIEETARLNPNASFVMIGPVVKISPDDLPRNKNVYWLGPRDYKVLPSYLKGSDITFMPFALNESTQYISPTKTLEFLAAGKPVISTAITDVVRDYSDVVHIVGNAQAITQAIKTIRKETEDVKHEWQNSVEEILAKTSWKKTADNMNKILSEVLMSNSKNLAFSERLLPNLVTTNDKEALL